MNKIRNIKIISIFTLTLLMICIFPFLSVEPVYAQPRTGDIEIDFEGRTDDRNDVILSGAKFEIFPIQYMENGVFVWRDEFANCGISLDDESAGAREEQAKALFEYAKKNNITGIIHVTDGTGHTSFLDLAEGMYLLSEIGDVENGVDTFESAPFLVKIPSEVNGEFEYDVDIEPKAEWVSHEGEPVGPNEDPKDDPEDNPKENPEKNPDKTKNTPTDESSKTILTTYEKSAKNIWDKVKTGDSENVLILGCTLVISAGVIYIIYKKTKNF